jgi:hypothetical protein
MVGDDDKIVDTVYISSYNSQEPHFPSRQTVIHTLQRPPLIRSNISPIQLFTQSLQIDSALSTFHTTTESQRTTREEKEYEDSGGLEADGEQVRMRSDLRNQRIQARIPSLTRRKHLVEGRKQNI